VEELRGDLDRLGARLAEDKAALGQGPEPFRFEVVGPLVPERLPPADPPAGKTPITQLTRVRIDCPDLCYRYTARLIRGVALSGRERAFVQAARGFGAGPGYLIRRHVLPLTAGVLVTQATILIPQYILAEVTLSFLGLGVGEPAPSWGNMLSEARQYHALVSHPWLLAPGLALIPVLLAFLVLADALLESPEP